MINAAITQNGLNIGVSTYISNNIAAFNAQITTAADAYLAANVAMFKGATGATGATGPSGIVASGTVTVANVTGNVSGTITATVPSGLTLNQIACFITNGTSIFGYVQPSSLSGTTLTIAYMFTGTTTNRTIVWRAFSQ